MPKVSEKHLDARRYQIIHAAYRCFGQKGFHRTTMRDICQEAGLSAGAVYNYYRSKDELIAAVGECGRQSTRRLLDSIDTPDESVDALSRMLETLLTMLDTPAVIDSSRFDLRLWAEAVGTPRLKQLFGEARDNAVAPFAEIIHRGKKRGEIDNRLDSDALARLLVSMLLGLQVQKAIDPETSATECVQSIQALLEGNLTGANEAAP